MKVQAQHLQKGQTLGRGETVIGVVTSSIHFPSNKVQVFLEKNGKQRSALWGKYTNISGVSEAK